ncbi:hypothetical protein L210DRAFT_3500826 [Boletus edulis BED1]|uniref:Uncharacterized protein n=1 Tax=Boletus edulis BED1 TaxID=1328754 RepID=A0AAD4GKM5_BOLED|nr:hypothetical protein L210DRAFT_3500826 [Boletus edulis BED1]
MSTRNHMPLVDCFVSLYTKSSSSSIPESDSSHPISLPAPSETIALWTACSWAMDGIPGSGFGDRLCEHTVSEKRDNPRMNVCSTVRRVKTYIGPVSSSWIRCFWQQNRVQGGGGAIRGLCMVGTAFDQISSLFLTDELIGAVSSLEAASPSSLRRQELKCLLVGVGKECKFGAEVIDELRGLWGPRARTIAGGRLGRSLKRLVGKNSSRAAMSTTRFLTHCHPHSMQETDK